MSMSVMMIRKAPMAMITHTHSGVAGASAGAAGAAGLGSVWKLNVALQSLGTGSTAITRQK